MVDGLEDQIEKHKGCQRDIERLDRELEGQKSKVKDTGDRLEVRVASGETHHSRVE